jgi:hypothetical protein
MKQETDRPVRVVPQPAKLAWVAPELEALPHLTELTLQSGIGGSGSTLGGGSTVF